MYPLLDLKVFPTFRMIARRNKNREKAMLPQRFEPRTISSTICHLSCPGTYIFKVGFRFRILGPELILVLPLVEVGLEPHRRFPGFRQQPGPKISGLLLDQHELDESRPDLEPGPLARIIITGWSLLFFKRSNPGLFFLIFVFSSLQLTDMNIKNIYLPMLGLEPRISVVRSNHSATAPQPRP